MLPGVGTQGRDPGSRGGSHKGLYNHSQQSTACNSSKRLIWDFYFCFSKVPSSVRILRFQRGTRPELREGREHSPGSGGNSRAVASSRKEERLGREAPVSALIPWLCKRDMLVFSLFQLFRGDLFKGTSPLSTCSGRIKSELDPLC